ncbi:class I SAM-dependent methyltransferase [Pollutibacter soli]|uniref:O-methyltransferase n=1 Tax=Pollutibacter soli TaxID=3034157 RepID=UPI0030134F67
MHPPFIIALKYIRYWLSASNGKGHGTHSPFVYNFIVKLLNDKREYAEFSSIESLRKKLLLSNEIIEVDDFGAGSVNGTKKKRKIAEIARLAAKPKKYAQLLFKIVRYYNSTPVVELGTSLGITTAYLASASQKSNVISLEGAPRIADVARKNMAALGLENVKIITGNFDDTFSEALKTAGHPGLVFFDGNHRYQPTMHYFNQALDHLSEKSIFIFDDIHWSEGMEKAWEEIKGFPSVTCTIDLFFIGLVFFNPDFKEKQHFVIRY